MHLSMHNWMRAESLDRTCERLAKCGYESIEIMGEPEQYVPGLVGKTSPTARPEQEWEWVVAGLREVYEHAGPKDVRMALEPLNRFETYFLNRGDQAMVLAKEVGEQCGVCLDCFHINIEEADPISAISAAAPRLADFHIADTNRYAAGMGHHDWPAIIETLRSVGYDGALTVEFVANIDRTPANPYPNALETEPVDISEEQAKFIEDHGSDVLTDEFYTWLVQSTADTLLPLVEKTAAPA